jgi:hypothetical protein
MSQVGICPQIRPTNHAGLVGQAGGIPEFVGFIAMGYCPSSIPLLKWAALWLTGTGPIGLLTSIRSVFEEMHQHSGPDGVEETAIALAV